MKRYTVRFAVLFMAFAIGISATYIFHKLYLQFEPAFTASIRVKPEGYGGCTAYKSFDGVTLSFMYIDFSLHEAADQAFQNKLREAAIIIERVPLYDRRGQTIVGEKMVAIFTSNDAAKRQWASIVSLDETHLYQISSPSLRHVLAFDKAHRRY